MPVRSGITFLLQFLRTLQPLSSSILGCLMMWVGFATALSAQRIAETPLGIAWRVQGSWQIDGKDAPIHNGDAVWPGSLLLPSEETVNHSITVLLPDGQRVLYECFTAKDCARDFRVPSLYRRPEIFSVDMMARIHAALVRGNGEATTGARREPLPRDEGLTVLGADNRILVNGLISALPNGRYTYDLRPLDRAQPRQFHVAFEKSAPSISLPLPSAGLYNLTIVDNLDTPRIDLLIAAVKPAQVARLRKSFDKAEETIEDWNGDYQGWPIHEFQRAYLESLVLQMGPLDLASRHPSTAARRSGVTAEPAFTPRAGVFTGDMAITLHCATPGATLHYTVDGSQPVNGSPLYGAPIMVKGTELTIKAFASAPGRKDSAVVTGIFRIQQ
jgi:hypothetical protein